MTNLEQRLRDGKGADRELDGYIAMHFDKIVPHYGNSLSKPADDWPNLGGHWAPAGSTVECTCRDDKHFVKPPAYTSDLNAVFALVERELPGAFVSVSGPFAEGMSGEPFSALIAIPPDARRGKASDRCRALLLALLAAKEQKHG